MSLQLITGSSAGEAAPYGDGPARPVGAAGGRGEVDLLSLSPLRADVERPAMAVEHVQIRIISLLEEAANSFEQLETLANRFLREIPAASVDAVEVKSLERDFVGTDNEPGSEMDHVVYIRYRTDKVEED